MALRTHTSADVRASRNGTEVTVAGWVHEVRSFGKLVFLVLRDRDGLIQATAKERALGLKMKEFAAVPRESVVSVYGRVVQPPKADCGAEVAAEDFWIVSEAGSPLPLGPADKVDIEAETALEHRALDLRRKRNQTIFRLRSDLCRAIRAAMAAREFAEVATPKIVSAGAEGGAILFPVDYFGEKAFLAQSPQLYKQMLVGAGFERVFEVGPAFRAEGSNTTRHLSEFTSFDAEMGFVEGMNDVMDKLEEVLKDVVLALANPPSGTRVAVDLHAQRFGRITYSDAVEIARARGVRMEGEPGIVKANSPDLPTEAERAVGEEMKERGHRFYFITHYPHGAKPFYIMENVPESYSFDLAFEGVEIASGGQREHRHDRLVDRMKRKGLDPEGFRHYLEPFRYGMPPHGGWGLGIERLGAALLGVKNVREMVMFPRDRGRLVP